MSSPSWRKSSRSNTQGNECVEVAELGDRIGIRDSKAADNGHLTLTLQTFATLVHRVKQEEATR